MTTMYRRHEMSRQWHDTMPMPQLTRSNEPIGCCGPCQQGRLACPCPQVCETAAADDGSLDAARGVLWALVAVALVGVSAYLALRLVVALVAA